MDKRTGTEPQQNMAFLFRLTAWLRALWQKLKNFRRTYNDRMKEKLSPERTAVFGAGLVLAAAVFILFLPCPRGVADDGSLAPIMKEVGLEYRQMDQEDPTGAYVTIKYLHAEPEPSGLSTHRGLIRIAIELDNLFTRDNLFDIRFLANLYLLLYIPSVWLLIRELARRVKYPSEATFVALLCALVFGDATYTTYFNSLYPEAMWLALLPACFGLALSLQRENAKDNQISFVYFMAAGVLLIFTEKHMAAVGLVLMIFAIRQTMMTHAARSGRLMAGVTAFALLTASVLSWTLGSSRFSENSKLNTMTTGVLLESDNPARTLEEFQIDPRFETLTDTSDYEDYPYTLAGNPELIRDFYPHYSTGALFLYYMRHPASMVALWNLGSKSAIVLRRDYVGNFVKAAGLPARARTPALVLWNTFRSAVLPKTMAAIVLLAVFYLFCIRRARNRRPVLESRERQIGIDTFFLAFGIYFFHMTAIVILSGSAEMELYSLPAGLSTDMMILMILTDELHRMNFLESAQGGK